MPREQLGALAADVDRLLAAGVAAAVGNDSLCRRSRTLRELGQKVPALVPVAEAIDRVTQSMPDRSAANLLDLTVLTRQIRAGLCTSDVPGEFHPLPASGPWQTPLPVRDVPPLVEALTRPGPGRETLLKDALERKALSDLRLVSPLLDALDDGHAPIADLVAQEVLPALGRAVLPELVAGLDLQGKAADTRRLHAICRIDRAMGAELCRKALNEGSQALRIQALKCLPEVGGPAEAEKAGLELCRDRNRDVRAAAVWALRCASAEEVLEEILVVLENDQDPNVQRNAVHALIHLPNQNTRRRLLDLLQKRLAGGEPPAEKGKKRSKTQTTTDGDAEQIQTTSLVIEALGSRRDKERAAVARALLPLARGNQPTLRQAALTALGRVGAVSKDVVPTLAEAVANNNSAIAEAAVTALAQLEAKEREPALPALMDVLAKSKGKGTKMRCSILAVLPGHIEHHRKAILKVMADAIRESDHQTPDVLSSALVDMGPSAQPLLPDVMAACRTKSAFLFYSNRDLMPAIDPEGAKAIPLLVKLMSDKLPIARYAALELLYSYGRKASRALPHIEKLRDDKDAYVRQAAERALAVIRA